MQVNPFAQQTDRRIDAVSALATAGRSADKRHARIKGLFPVLLMAVFFVALLLAIGAGLVTYSKISATQTTINNERMGLGVIVNSVRASDSSGCIAQGEGPEGKSLVIVERLDSGTYETRFYAYQGMVLQEYALQTTPYNPAKANLIVKSGTFDFGYANDLLWVSCDQGTVEVSLRNLQGGA